MYAKKSGPTKKMRRTGVKALHAGRKRQSATAGRDTESNARTYQNILRVETESQRGQSGKTKAARPAGTENRSKIMRNRGPSENILKKTIKIQNKSRVLLQVVFLQNKGRAWQRNHHAHCIPALPRLLHLKATTTIM